MALQKSGKATHVADEKMLSILVSGNYIALEDKQKALDFAEKEDTHALEYLYKENLITNDLLGQAISEHFSVVYADLNSHKPPHDQIVEIPEEIALKYRVVLFEKRDTEYVVATDSPKARGLLGALKELFPQKKIVLAFSLPIDIDAILIEYRKALSTRFASIIETKDRRIAPTLIEEIVEEALVFRASDIHFEPREGEVIIRFRIDGILKEAGRLPKDLYETVLNRIKVLGRLRTDEHRAAQDGAIRFRTPTISVDLRVSILPLIDGEKVVIRVLSSYIRNFTLGDIGLSDAHQTILLAAAKKPFGMILVTGPTGSGKTTTLYSLIKILNNPEINIATIEDPVEYKIEGVNHMSVNNQTNLSFAEGLRSIVRQDPDIILVGEIRDKETAEIAVNAALTGHLLFSTFHANDAATAIPRLLDMGIESFLLSSTLELVIGQRLVRRICEQCKYSKEISKEEVSNLSPQAANMIQGKSLVAYEGKGCEACNHSGFSGRTGVFELIPVGKEMQECIVASPNAHEVWTLARTLGTQSMFENGMEKVLHGETTIAELVRVVPPSRAE